jgi:hypothetical protein
VYKSLGQIWNHFFEIFRTSFHYVVVITNSTITSTIISIYDHNNFPSIFAKYCARCHLMSHNYISQSLVKYKSCCESNYNSSQSDNCLFFFPQEHVPKVLNIDDYIFSTRLQFLVENTSLVYKARNKDLCQWLSIKLLSSQTRDLCQWLFIKLLSSQHIIIAIVITTFHYMLF